jgi:hypothetical protein
MIPKLVSDAIRINARPELRLRPGDFVSIKVIKRIVGAKYAVALQGRVIPAYSKLDLAPGSTLRVLVSRAGNRYELRIAEGKDGKADQLLELLQREGLGTDKATAAVVMAMMKTGLAVRAATVSRIKSLLRRLRLEPGRFSRLIALIMDKKLDLSDTALEGLVGLLGYGERGGRDAGEKRRRRGKEEQRKQPEQRKELAGLLRETISREERGRGNVLQLFNHLPGSRESWIVVPYGFQYRDSDSSGRGEAFELRGTLRLRYGKRSSSPERLVLTAASGRRHWSFHLEGEGEPLRLTVFASQPGLSPPGWQNLKTNLQNLGVEVDDTIREDTGFDGFSLPWEEIPYQSVNTQG